MHRLLFGFRIDSGILVESELQDNDPTEVQLSEEVEKFMKNLKQKKNYCETVTIECQKFFFRIHNPN